MIYKKVDPELMNEVQFFEPHLITDIILYPVLPGNA